MANYVEEIENYLMSIGDASIAEHSTRFFKTGIGEYGEGDLFLGIRVPIIRKAAKKYQKCSLQEIEHLLHSKYHEIRLFAVIMLADMYPQAGRDGQDKIYKTYLNNTEYINNWDLVDASAHKIVGPHLLRRDRQKLYELAVSISLWERRIAIIATYHFIRQNQFDDVVGLAELLLHDHEDLIHKAVGWMLREMGKRSVSKLHTFLDKNCVNMPRTMLRYAIEKLPQTERKDYLGRTV